MGCGSSSAKAVSTTSQKPSPTQNGASTKDHSDAQNNLRESKVTNGFSHAKEGKYDNNSNEKPKIKPDSNQEHIKPTENQENDKNLLNSSELNGKLSKIGDVNW